MRSQHSPRLPGPSAGDAEARWARVGHGLHRPAEVDDVFLAELAAWQLLLPEDACFHPSAPAETLLACARDLGLLDLVVLIDSALRDRDGQRGSVTADELEAVSRRRAWGAPRLREARLRSDARAESPWECLLRILHVVCGIHVEPQYELHTADGRFVARGDLWLRGTTRFHEYDGGDHRPRRQQRRDLKRSGRIDDRDWSRRGYTSTDVLGQGVRILRDADEALGREHQPERIRAWHALLRGSLFTPAGTALLRKRWRLGTETSEDAA